MELNQGIGAIWENGVATSERAYTVPLIAGRDATLRLLWRVDAGFEPRELEARFTVQAGAETLETTATKWTMVVQIETPMTAPGISPSQPLLFRRIPPSMCLLRAAGNTRQYRGHE